MITRIQEDTSIKKYLTFFCGVLMSCAGTADPIWHCSRTDMQVADASDSFTLSALDDREVVQISLVDLYTVYQGSQISVSGRQLSACFIGGDDAVTSEAMRSIGIDPSLPHALSRKSTIGSSRLHMVRDEKSMATCIKKHHPAIGYLSKATHTEAMGPCF
jgi:hypothetical protein